MLANYRCSEIKDAILNSLEEDLRQLYAQSTKENIENFKNICLQIYDRAVKEYDKTASNYVDKIYRGMRKNLEDNLSQKFYVCFNNQAQKIIPLTQKFMRQDLQKELKKCMI